MNAIERRKGSIELALQPLDSGRNINAMERRNSDVELQPFGRDDRWRKVFARYDHDNDGRIEVQEFLETLRREKRSGIPAHVYNQIKQSVNQSSSTYITYSEFLKLIQTEQPKNILQRVLLNYIKYTIPRRSLKVDRTDGEYEDQYTCEPPAVCMLLVSIIEISLFIYDSLSKGYTSISGPTATVLIYNPYRRMEVWRFLSYMFVHVGTFHLAVNIVVQILLGVPLEMVHGWWRVLIVYLSGVLSGSLCTSISDPRVYLAGASGGVYALITAHIATIILNWSEMQFAFWQLLVFLVLTVTDLGSAIYNRYINVDDKIGYVAHLAGAFSGLLVGLYVLRNLEVHSWEKKISRFAVIVYLVLMIACIVFNFTYSGYFPIQERV